MVIERVRQINTPAEAYKVAVSYGEYKATCALWLLFLKAVYGGYCASLGGHAAMVLASVFYNDHSYGAAKLAFGIIFSGALICLMYTGADLVTSNCMNFALLAYARRISPLTYIVRMLTSLLGNYIGALIGAGMLSVGTGYFTEGIGAGGTYLNSVYEFKVSLAFWRVICSAIGCNSYVCMAVWACYVSLDSAGSVLSMVLLITSFAVAGFEHIVANFYTLHAALFCRPNASGLAVYVYNLLPTLLGNYIGGSVIVALPLHLMYGLAKKQTPLVQEATSVI